MSTLFALLAGLLFGIGLIVSGMTNPAKVIGFLDIAGTWDPSLAFVMVGAIAVGLASFRIGRLRAMTLLGEEIHWPTATDVDRRLIGGSALFGIGWGLAGICPGPGVVLLGSGCFEGLIFIPALLAGMALFEFTQRR